MNIRQDLCVTNEDTLTFLKVQTFNKSICMTLKMGWSEIKSNQFFWSWSWIFKTLLDFFSQRVLFSCVFCSVLFAHPVSAISPIFLIANINLCKTLSRSKINPGNEYRSVKELPTLVFGYKWRWRFLFVFQLYLFNVLNVIWRKWPKNMIE